MPPKPRIAVFRLAGAVKETPTDEVFNFGGETGVPLETLVARMDKAAKDSAVKAVVILLDQADGRPGPGRGAAAGDRPRSGGGQGGHRPRRHDRRPGPVHPALGGLAPERRPHGRPLDHRPLRRVALPPAAARQARRQARLPDLRRLQERRGDLHARGAQQGSRGDAELAARQPLRHPGRAGSPPAARSAPSWSRPGSTAARTPPRRPRSWA